MPNPTEWTEETLNPTAWSQVVTLAGFILLSGTTDSYLLQSDGYKLYFTI